MYSEKAIENFYNWEITGRGYSLFPYSVKLEPEFRNFYHYYPTNEYVDDGKVPTLLQKLFPKNKVLEKEPDKKPPKHYEYSSFLKFLNIRIQLKQKFDNDIFLELINMLSESNEQISFEIIGKYKSIDIQIVCNIDDSARIIHLLQSYFPSIIIQTSEKDRFPFNSGNKIIIVDFGYDEEFIRPINNNRDHLLNVISVFDSLRMEETIMFQIIFQGVSKPWASSILNSVSIGNQSFFPDSPEMLTCAKAKTSNPLFAVVLRLAVQSQLSLNAESIANEIISNIKTSSKSEYNSLIPLSNQNYSYNAHLENLKLRGTNRSGMIMNSKELASFFNISIFSKQNISTTKTKSVPTEFVGNKYFVGINEHLGIIKEVSLNDEQRLRHCHIIGATGTGKSTFISNLFLEDVKCGNGCVIFDPHGDTIDDIIERIPEDRINDVILFDPADSEYSVGFNLLSAKSEVEKIVLSSDLVDAFIRHSTTWGDQMTSVLSNAINTFLNSERIGTLLELKRFLIEESFRKEFLKSVNDKYIHYYWEKEYILLKKVSISPLLTRLDTFLRPKIIRNILAQKEGLDFRDIIENKKILLVKLSQGLIGEENSYLLGALILSKIYQVAQSRQNIHKNQRHPFYVYLDEFHNFITPSINSILSGSRKYGIGLILAHQDLNQIKDQNVYNSVISNTFIRLCFRLGDIDSKKLESGFSFFESIDLQNLNTGESIVRIGRNIDDFTLKITPFSGGIFTNNTVRILNNSRDKYYRRIDEINGDSYNPINKLEELALKNNENLEQIKLSTGKDINAKGADYIESIKEKEEVREHRYLQQFVKNIAEQRGFKATIEEGVEGGRIDVVLVRDEIKIACEVAVSNSVVYEVKNIQKCINAGFSNVCVITKDDNHSKLIKEKLNNGIGGLEGVRFISIKEFSEFLDFSIGEETTTIKRIKGYRIKVTYSN